MTGDQGEEVACCRVPSIAGICCRCRVWTKQVDGGGGCLLFRLQDVCEKGDEVIGWHGHQRLNGCGVAFLVVHAEEAADCAAVGPPRLLLWCCHG